MIGSIIGDVVGSGYEFWPVKHTDFEMFNERSRFTDDTILGVAVADVLMNDDLDYTTAFKKYARKFPEGGYGKGFAAWVAAEDPEAYNSYGNGSAMRVAPVGFWFDTLEETLAEAKRSAEPTHNHEEGIKGAQAVAASIFLARTGSSKEEIKKYVEDTFGYDLSRTCDEIRPNYSFDVTCQGSVPEAIIAFLESKDYEHAIRLAVSLGGDADTQAAITGGIAQAFYKTMPEDVMMVVSNLLHEDLRATTIEFLKVVAAKGEANASAS